MTDALSRGAAGDQLAFVRAALAATCACEPDDFRRAGVVVVPATERPGRLRFPAPSRQLLVVTLGAGVVLSADPARLEWLREFAAMRGRDDIFGAEGIAALAAFVASDGQRLVGPVLKHICSVADVRNTPAPPDARVEVVDGDDVAGLYRVPGFGEALSYRVGGPRPDVLAVVARRAGSVAGVSAASADSDALWQVGVEVAPAARGAGIGRALVERLTAEVLRRGRVPYYSTTVGNIASRAVARAVGYRPAWTELYVLDRQ